PPRTRTMTLPAGAVAKGIDWSSPRAGRCDLLPVAKPSRSGHLTRAGAAGRPERVRSRLTAPPGLQRQARARAAPRAVPRRPAPSCPWAGYRVVALRGLDRAPAEPQTRTPHARQCLPPPPTRSLPFVPTRAGRTPGRAGSRRV